jgi:outer membrane biosynthesis protein TonB
MTADNTLRASDVPRLVVLLPDGKEVHHHVAGEEVTIGRDPSNRICLSDHFVSKFHAKLLVSARTITLVDLGSANKTYVNGEPITQKPLRFGDAIRFASVECRLEGPEAAAKPAPVAAIPASPAKPAPPPPKPEPPVRASAPAPKPRPAAAPKAPGRPAPPPVEADPMKRLLVIGGVLILLSLVLGIVLRVLLVPSDAPETVDEAAPKSAAPSASSAAAPQPVTTPPSSIPPEASSSPAPPPSTPSPVVDASGNRSAEFYFDEGLSYLDTGRLKEAQTSFRKVLELDPDHSRARTRLSLLDEEIESKAKRHFDAAREAFQFLRYDEAIAEWEMFLLLADPGDVRYAEAQGGIEQAKAKLR